MAFILQGGGVGLLQEGEEGITRLERRLYFTTAHGHFKAGCPALALEVLSKLPTKILDDHAPPTSPAKQLKRRDTQIDTGELEWGAPPVVKAEGLCNVRR